MKKTILLLLVFICFGFLVKAQNSYTSVGVTASYFAPISSKPIILKPYNANSVGIFVEHYYNNHRKLGLGANYYEHRYAKKYRDIDTARGTATEMGVSKFITVPITASYNFVRGDKRWEFFVDAGFLNFIHNRTTVIYDHTTVAIKRHTYEATNLFTNHYFMAGITARYKLHEKLYFGFGTKTHHYLKLTRRVNTGFPTISLDGNIAYVF